MFRVRDLSRSSPCDLSLRDFELDNGLKPAVNYAMNRAL
jgi:hypothetical protein